MLSLDPLLARMCEVVSTLIGHSVDMGESTFRAACRCDISISSFDERDNSLGVCLNFRFEDALLDFRVLYAQLGSWARHKPCHAIHD